MKLTVVTYPAKVLKKVAKPIDEVTPEIKKLLDDMVETMYTENGVGLAAPQVAQSIRCIVVDVGIEQPDGSRESNLYQLINPEIVQAEGEQEYEEGCLSVPNFTITMQRAAKVTLKALDRDGKEITIEAEGLLAVALQHEIDHLDGKVLIDNVSRIKRELYVKEQKRREEKHEPVFL